VSGEKSAIRKKAGKKKRWLFKVCNIHGKGSQQNRTRNHIREQQATQKKESGDGLNGFMWGTRKQKGLMACLKKKFQRGGDWTKKILKSDVQV